MNKKNKLNLNVNLNFIKQITQKFQLARDLDLYRAFVQLFIIRIILDIQN